MTNLQNQPVSRNSTDGLLSIIRHSSDFSENATWADTTLLRVGLASSTSQVLPQINGTYFLKFENPTGERSNIAGRVALVVPDSIPALNFEIAREDIPFPGLHPFLGQGFGVYYDSEYDGLVLDGDARIDDIRSLDPLDTIDARTDLIDTWTDIDGGVIGYSNAGTFDELPSVDFVGNRGVSGVYHFQKILDLGDPYTVSLKRVLTNRGLYPLDTIDARTALIDTWTDVDGEEVDDTTADVYFRTTDQATEDTYFLTEDGDNLLFGDTVLPDQNIVTQAADQLITQGGDIIQTNQTTSGFVKILKAQDDDTLITQSGDTLITNDVETPVATGDDKIMHESNLVFSEWTPLENVEASGRQFQFKAELNALHPDQTPIVDKLGAIVQMERRVESSGILTSDLDQTLQIDFLNSFYVDNDTKVVVAITAYDLDPADKFRITEPTSTGFTIVFTNSAEQRIRRRFQYTAIGYGTKQS